MLKWIQKNNDPSGQPDSKDVPFMSRSESKSMKKQNPSMLEKRTPPVGILVGQTGTGKTTLLNKVCGTEYETGASQTSITRNLFKNHNNVGDSSFELIDTPGTDSQEEPYQHAVLLREALTMTDLNTIFAIVKYDSRHFRILENFLAVQSPVFQFKKKIVVVISHWDQSTQPKKEVQEIMKIFDNHCSNFLFCSEKHDSTQIADLIFKFLSQMPSERLEISDQEFFESFNVFKIRHSMFRDHGIYENKLRRLEVEFYDLSQSADIHTEERDEFIHSLIVSFSVESEKLLEEFRKKHGGDMIQLDYYTFWIKLQKDCLQSNDLFVKNMSLLMSYDVNDPHDPLNFIKKCPYCSLVWFKTEGCNGRTSCGNRVNKFHDTIERESLKFEFIRLDDGSYKWEKTTLAPIQKEKLQGNKEKKGVGCGKKFWWRWASRVEEKKILELFHAKTIDEIKQMIANPDFIEQRKKIENEIDKQFHSSPIS